MASENYFKNPVLTHVLHFQTAKDKEEMGRRMVETVMPPLVESILMKNKSTSSKVLTQGLST